MNKSDSTRNDSDETRATIPIGTVLGDFYIVGRIGFGAMAEVYLARQKSLDRPVALKILRKSLAGDETYVRRFIQEAQAAARLDHPNIVRIYGVGSLPDPDKRPLLRRVFGLPFHFHAAENELHYISQEYVSGLNLQQVLLRHGPFSLERTLSILYRVAMALREAAAAGIVHRDIKPENILLSESGILKIAVFGLARFESPAKGSDLSLTQIGMTLGTPLYMSPEQSQGKSLDFRSDVYSLGITAFQLLTGRTPFVGESPIDVVAQHLKDLPPKVSSIRPDVPPALDVLIARMLAKNPDYRFASPDELIETIRQVSSDVATVVKTANHETLQITDHFSLEKPFDSDDTEFQDTMQLTAMSIQLQTEQARFEEIRHRTGIFPSWKITIPAVLFVVVMFAIGFLFAVSGRRSTGFFPPAASSTIHRFDTVEEQWVFACQLDTADAWKSISLYFPNEQYWQRKAMQQLAWVYLSENNLHDARPIFIQFTEMPDADRQYVSFGEAGIAWCMAIEGNTTHASSILSRLRSATVSSYDRMTEDLIAKTQDIIRNRKS